MTEATPQPEDKGFIVRAFGAVERWGQMLPDPLTLFFIMASILFIITTHPIFISMHLSMLVIIHVIILIVMF